MSSTKATKVAKKEVVKDESKPEPVVETKPEVVDEAVSVDDEKKVTFDELMEQFNEQYKAAKQVVLGLGGMIVQIRRAHNQAMRVQSQKKKPRRVAVDSGILKPVALPAEAVVFLKDVGVTIPESGLMRRTELSGAIYDYVKSKTLYKPDPSRETGFDRKVIIPDEKLRKLFSLGKDATLDFSSINSNLAVIYKHAKEVAGDAPVVSAPAPAPAPAPAKAAPVKATAKGKAAITTA
jgi:hypothetical protein